MLLVLDENGDEGLDFGSGASVWLVIAGCLFDDRDHAAECEAELVAFRKTTKVKELHFTRDPDARRRRVLALIARFRFTYHAVAVDKRNLKPRDWRPGDIYDRVAGRLVNHLLPRLTDCTLWFDTKGGKKVDQKHGSRLVRLARRAKGDAPRIARAAGMNSRKQPLVQLADYVCGAVSRSIRADTDDADDYRRLIAAREGEVLLWTGEK